MNPNFHCRRTTLAAAIVSRVVKSTLEEMSDRIAEDIAGAMGAPGELHVNADELSLETFEVSGCCPGADNAAVSIRSMVATSWAAQSDWAALGCEATL
jgi:hypothetical protein